MLEQFNVWLHVFFCYFFCKHNILFGPRAEGLITRSAQCDTVPFVYTLLKVSVCGLFHRARMRAVCGLTSNVTCKKKRSLYLFETYSRLISLSNERVNLTLTSNLWLAKFISSCKEDFAQCRARAPFWNGLSPLARISWRPGYFCNTVWNEVPEQ